MQSWLPAFYIPYNAVDGGWSDWIKVYNCSVTCGGEDIEIFVRICSNPYPADGGKPCEGLAYKTEACGYCPCK